MGDHARLLAALLAIASTAGLARAGADEGKALYEKQCKICHSVAGDKGKMADKGGALDGIAREARCGLARRTTSRTRSRRIPTPRCRR